MDAQVRVLELEKELEQERLRLAALRRRHYQLAGEGEFFSLCIFTYFEMCLYFQDNCFKGIIQLNNC